MSYNLRKNSHDNSKRKYKQVFKEKQIENMYLLKQKIKSSIKEMGKHLEAKEHENVLKLGHRILRLFASLKKSDLNKSEFLSLRGCMFMLLCKSEIENNNYSAVIDYAPTLSEIAYKMDNTEFSIDVNNIIAQSYIKAEDYNNAAKLWKQNLKLARNKTEKAFFYHEIGRCYYQLTQFAEARLFGMWSLVEAFAAMNNWWCLNAALLVAQSETLMGFNEDALKSFNEAEKYASIEDKQDIIDFIKSQKQIFIKAIATKSSDSKNKL